MKCWKARNRIALWVGRDLGDPEAQPLQQHLADCSGCRDYWLEMKQSMDLLQQASGEHPNVTRFSLWPRISWRIANHRRPLPSNQFNGWLPALAIVAACLMIIVVSNQPTPPSFSDSSTTFSPISAGQPGLASERLSLPDDVRRYLENPEMRLRLFNEFIGDGPPPGAPAIRTVRNDPNRNNSDF